MTLSVMKRAACAVLFCTCVLSATLHGACAEQGPTTVEAETPEQLTASPASPEVIAVPAPAVPLTEVAIRATEIDDLLQSWVEELSPGPDVEKIRSDLPEVSLVIDRALAANSDILGQHPTLPVLQGQQQKWQRSRLRLSDWLENLRQWSGSIRDALERLEDLEKIWTATREDAVVAAIPLSTLDLIDRTITHLHKTRSSLQLQRVEALELQILVGREYARCDQALIEIGNMQQAAVSNILTRDIPPIWSRELWSGGHESISGLRGALARYRGDLSDHLKPPSKYMLLTAAALVLLTSLFMVSRNRVRKWHAEGHDYSPFIKVFEYPVAAALTVTLLFVTSPYRSPLPATLRDTFQILALAPMIILVRPYLPRYLQPYLIALGTLFAIDAMRDILFAGLVIEQVFLIFEAVVGTVLLILFQRTFREFSGQCRKSRRNQALQPLTFFALLLLGVGLVAAATGYLRLARMTIPGTLALGVVTLAMYASLRVLIGMVSLSFQVWPLRTLHMVHRHHELLEQRIYRVLLLAATFGIFIRYIGYIGLFEPILSGTSAVFTAKLESGGVSISPADILLFLLVVWGAYLLSGFIRFVLREDIYPRIGIGRGISFAISSLLHYFMLTFGFIIAIGFLGVDLTRLTVLTGALGIGIGFGLQGVVNNFVSGLIMLFERPVQVGDTVEVGNFLGKVKKIGIRASTVRTRQGADVILPNSELITGKVTNWTFGDQMKRIDLPIGVSYSSSPASVTELLFTVADNHPEVLREPAPQGLFVGFGDSSIDYELRVWTELIDDWPRIRSELGTAIFDAIQAADMTIPYPQREVRLLQESRGEVDISAGPHSHGTT